MMPIKTKLMITAVFFVANLFIVEAVFRVFYPTQPVMVRILVQEAAGGVSSDILSKLNFSNTILNDTILKAAVLRPSAAAQKFNPATDLDSRAKVVQEKDANIIRIIVSGEDRNRAAAEANRLAEETVKYYAQQSQNSLTKEADMLRQEAERRRSNRMGLLSRIEGLKGRTHEEPAAAILENEIQSREARITVLLETYKPQHPEIVGLKKELEQLKKQKVLQRGVPADPLPALLANYESEKAAHQSVQAKLTQILMRKEQEIKPLKILTPAVGDVQPRLRTFPYAFPLALTLILAAAIWGVYWSRPKD